MQKGIKQKGYAIGTSKRAHPTLGGRPHQVGLASRDDHVISTLYYRIKSVHPDTAQALLNDHLVVSAQVPLSAL